MADTWDIIHALEDAAGYVLWLLDDGQNGGARERNILQADGAYRMTAELSQALRDLGMALDLRVEDSESDLA